MAKTQHPLEKPKEYLQGVEDFNRGKSDKDCPFGNSNKRQRQHWFNGFYDAEVSKRVGHILQKYGLSYP